MVIKLTELIRETNYSQMALANEAGVSYNTLMRITKSQTRRPRTEDAQALLSLLNRARVAEGLPQLQLEEIAEFTNLRPAPAPAPSSPVGAATGASGQRRRNRQRVQTHKGRPKGNRIRPAKVELLSASERFLAQVFGPQGYANITLPLAYRLLEAVVEEIRPGQEQANSAAASVPAVVDLRLPSNHHLNKLADHDGNGQETTSPSLEAGFTLIVSQLAAQHHPAFTPTPTTTSTRATRPRPGTVSFAVEVGPASATTIQRNVAASVAEKETTWQQAQAQGQVEAQPDALVKQAESEGEERLDYSQLVVWLKQYQEVVPPIVPGGDLALSWAEFERLTLLQLKLLVDFYLAQAG